MTSSSTKPGSRETIALLLMLACLAGILATGIGVFPLQEPDEGRYGLIAYEMVQSGDWITPHLDTVSYFEKPPLFFWLAAISIKAFGTAEWVIRLPSLLAAIAATALVMLLARRTFGQKTALVAGIVFATTPLVALFARVCIVDVVLTFLITAQLALLWYALVEPDETEPPHLGRIVLFHVAAGLAMLNKGPVGIALPAVAFTAYALLAKRPRLLARVLHPVGLATFAAVSMPWFVAMHLRHPGYLHDFFLHENLARFSTGGEFKREAPFYTYLALLPVAFLPWASALPEAFRLAWGERTRDDSTEKRARWFFGCAVVAPLLLLSVAQSKLVYYILPLMPPLAIVAADALTRRRGDSDRPARSIGLGFGIFAALMIALAIAVGVAAMLPDARIANLFYKGARAEALDPPIDVMRHAVGWFAAALGVAGIATALASRWIRKDKALEAVGAVAVGMVILMTSIPFLASRPMQSYTGKRFAALVGKIARPDDKLLFYERFQRTTVYYLERPVMLWNANYTEFGHEVGPEEAAGRGLQADPAALANLVRGPDRVLVLTSRVKDEKAIREMSPVPLYELGRVGTRAVLANRPPGPENEKDTE